ncbi:MAG: beta-glucuronidase [Clostridia bacterium]|nr:beta-glucuronidase [Clostridia bacterium]
MRRRFDEHEIRDVRSLDGAWLFCTDGDGAGEKLGWAKALPKGQKVTVPGVWNTQLGLLQYEGAAWYQKEFYTNGGCLRFCFDAVMTEARVYLDGEPLGEHYGGFCRFELIARDVTPGYHTLTVRVDNRFDEHSIPQKKVDWYHYGGITRGVSVERLSGICVLYQKLDYTLSPDLTSASAAFTLELYNAEKRKKSTRVRVLLNDLEVYRDEIAVSAGETVTIKTPAFTVENVSLWDTDAPNLYSVTVLTDTDDLRDRVGFRLIEARDGAIFLNHRRVELRGINRHEEHPDWGMAFPQGLMERDLDIILEAGCNTVRGSHYPNSRVFLDMLDERGVLFWSEIPIWGCGFAPETLADPVIIARGLEMHREMVRHYYNHPAIVIWGMHNEIRADLPESVEMSRQYYHYLKENGGNRIVTYAANHPMEDICLAYCDMISINKYLGWYPQKGVSTHYTETWRDFLDQFRKRRAELGMEQKPVVMGEFGGAGIYGHHTFDHVKGTEEYQADLLGFCLELFHADPMMAGTYVWQFADIRTAPEMGLDRARGYNNKGIVNEYRKPKAAYFAVREAYLKFAKESEK